MNIYLSVFLTWFLAQFVMKPIYFSIKKRKFVPQAVFYNSGMPSGHTALVSSLATSVWLVEGAGNLFLVTIVFAFIVIFDTYLVRTYLVKQTPLSILDESLLVGHEPIEILVGLIVGIGCPLLIWMI